VIEELVLQGLSYRDAAEVLNIPEGTLRSRLIAAKRALVELAEPLLPRSQRGPR
jgi:DNA-directed RNA polymerase specialized sigma24 family protein